MFRTDTAGTPALNKGVRCASVPAVPEGTISTSTPYRAEWPGINRFMNGSSAAKADDDERQVTGNPVRCSANRYGYDTFIYE